MGGAAVGGAAACVIGCGHDLAARDASFDSLSILSILPNPVGNVLTLTFAMFPVLRYADGWVRGTPPAFGQQVIVINTGPAYVALNAVCTHLSCGVNYDQPDNLLLCPCHGSEFSLAGAVVRGPATTGLPVYAASSDGEGVHITLA